MKTPEERIEAALELAFGYGQIDGSHHKQWVIVEMVKELIGDAAEYAREVEDYKYRGGKELVYDWDEGIAP